MVTGRISPSRRIRELLSGVDISPTWRGLLFFPGGNSLDRAATFVRYDIFILQPVDINLDQLSHQTAHELRLPTTSASFFLRQLRPLHQEAIDQGLEKFSAKGEGFHPRPGFDVDAAHLARFSGCRGK